jgi:DNA topoisomerase-1
VQKFDGFLKVYEEAPETKRAEEKNEEEEERNLPAVNVGEKLTLNSITPEQHFTEPPPRYSEATLVKALEEKGIGRPSTYAAIMTTIQDREYVEKIEGRFHPTPLGTTVNDLLIESFDDIFNTKYTARMEEELDEIEDGKLAWQDALREFYGKFSKDLEVAAETIKGKKKMSIPTDEVCEKCGAGMVIKFGRFGQFLACSNYPECQNTREVGSKQKAEAGQDGATGSAEEIPPCELCGREMALKKGRFGSFYGCTGYPECKNIRKIAKGDQKPLPPPVQLDELCPKDGANLVRRHGRFGEFTACSNYPKCDYVKRETIGLACPKCGGDIAVKKSRRGKVFYGCVNYPNCDEVYWDKPVKQTCPKCSSPILLEKTTKKEGTFRYCRNEDCDFKMPVSDTGQNTPGDTEVTAPKA